MTTPAAEALYLAQHNFAHEGRQFAVYNPHSKPVNELPFIYGFNNGGPRSFLQGLIIAESGHVLGSHLCSHEGYMLADLGVLENTRPDRHEKDFRTHYPDGYRMTFVSRDQVLTHPGLLAAIELHEALKTD